MKKILTIDFTIFADKYLPNIKVDDNFCKNKNIKVQFNEILYNNIFNNRFIKLIKKLNTNNIHFIYDQSVICSNVKNKDILINVDFFNDCFPYSILPQSNSWVNYLYQEVGIKYQWIKGENSPLKHNKNFLSIYENTNSLFDDSINELYICLSKKYIKEEHWHYFYDLKEKCEKIKNTQFDILEEPFKNFNSSVQGTKNCICTLLSSDSYYKGVLGLYSTVHRFSSNDFIVLCTDKVSDFVFSRFDHYKIKYKKIESLKSEGEHKVSNLFSGFTRDMTGIVNKIYAFTLCEYEKVLFIDADSVIVHNTIDILFNLLPEDKYFCGTRCKIYEKTLDTPDGRVYTSNLFLLRPSMEYFNILKNTLEENEWGVKLMKNNLPIDGGLFESVFGCNLLKVPSKVMVYHYSDKIKYWNTKTEDETLAFVMEFVILMQYAFCECGIKDYELFSIQLGKLREKIKIKEN